MPMGRPWTHAEIALFGTAPDAAIAKRLGTTKLAITVGRSLRGIPAFSRAIKRPWGNLELSLLRDNHTDSSLARMLNRGVDEITEKRRELKSKS
jgi:hypothetical protein